MINFTISLTVEEHQFTTRQYPPHVELGLSFTILTIALLGDSGARLLCREDL